MTDEQIIKALECCMAGSLCHKCPCYGGACVVGGGYALDLIQRLKAENERLTAERDEARRDCAVAERNHALAVEERVANVKGFTEQLATARADAVRVFAERAKAHTRHLPSAFYFGNIVDELVEREMTEGEK